MEYDIETHVAQQIENFLNGYDAADIGIMERSKSNFKAIMETANKDKVVGSIDTWDKKKIDEMEKIWKKATEASKLITVTKKGEELFVDVEEIKQDLANSFNLLEGEYWDSIRGLMLGSIQDEQV